MITRNLVYCSNVSTIRQCSIRNQRHALHFTSKYPLHISAAPKHHTPLSQQLSLLQPSTSSNHICHIIIRATHTLRPTHPKKRSYWSLGVLGSLAFLPLLHNSEDKPLITQPDEPLTLPPTNLIENTNDTPNLLSPLTLLRLITRVITLAFFFTPVILTFPLWWYMNKPRLRNGEEVRVWWINLLVWTLERCGGLFVKLGQWASSRGDIVPSEICDVLGKLQNRVKPHNIQATRKAIEELYGARLEENFVEFDEVPVGVGAVAQVHRAVLKPVGTNPLVEVAVKVLHPNIRSKVHLDLALIEIMGRLVNLLPGAKYLSIPQEISTFSRMMADQMDLRIEARNLRIFSENFEAADEKGKRKGAENVIFPKPIRCNPDVLVETFHRGLLLSEFLNKGPTEYDSALADLGVRAFMQMILRDNFFHCDLHPGNIIVTFTLTPEAPGYARKAGAWLSTKMDPSASTRAQLLFRQHTVDYSALDNLRRAPKDAWGPILHRMLKEGYTPQIVILDAGLVGSLSPKNMENVRDSFKAGLEYDGAKIAELLLTRCREPANVCNPEIAKETLSAIMNDLKTDNRGALPLSTIHTAKVIKRVAKLLRDHRIGLDGEFVGLFVCCVLVEGVGRRLHAEMDLLEPLAMYL